MLISFRECFNMMKVQNEYLRRRNICSLYCDACNTLGSTIGVTAQLLNNGENLECKSGLSPGIYDSIELAFCLPPVEEILKTQGLNRESFLSLVQSEVCSAFSVLPNARMPSKSIYGRVLL